MNEFMHFTPIFTVCEEFFAAVTEEAILSILLPLIFILAVALVCVAGFATVPQTYTASILQSFGWWKVGVQMDDDYHRRLWYQALGTEDVLSVGESPVSEDLLSRNPLKARRARKKFWGKKWDIARKELTPEQRMAVYRRILNR